MKKYRMWRKRRNSRKKDQREKYISFEKKATGIKRREAAGRGIGRLEPNIEGKLYDTNTGTHFFQIKEPKG